MTMRSQDFAQCSYRGRPGWLGFDLQRSKHGQNSDRQKSSAHVTSQSQCELHSNLPGRHLQKSVPREKLVFARRGPLACDSSETRRLMDFLFRFAPVREDTSV